MRLLVNLALLVGTAASCSAGHLTYFIHGTEPEPWPRVLATVGLRPGQAQNAQVIVVRPDGKPDVEAVRQQVKQGAVLVLEGYSSTSSAFGVQAGATTINVRSLRDQHLPDLPIIWQQASDLAAPVLPEGARVFTVERWQKAPVVAGFKLGQGAVLWLATSPGTRGYERYPYLLQAMQDLGLQPPFVSKDLWAFFDSSYRSRVDLDYFAERWRKSGISTLHVAGWHYFEADPEHDAYLQQLIQACHRQAILVYVWLELPHVSEQFWIQHPEWREKTAVLQDAQLDWRKLMNLQNRECFKQVAFGIFSLLQRFDWDGVNMAELYFESLEGEANPARFTPMNRDVRSQFGKSYGFDPVELFQSGSAHARAQHPEELQKFLHFRARLAERMQSEWLEILHFAQEKKKYLEVVLTHVDDRYDTRMRDLIGADANRVLPLLDQREFTFLIEDPATIWHLGPDRYPQIASRYQPLTTHQDKLAIDINIVERYQDVYPTKQQTGTELFQLVHLASQAFNRVALYFENSLLPPDLALLPSAAAVVDKAEWQESQLLVSSPRGVGVPWIGMAKVDGRTWPVTNGQVIWLPAGHHTVEPATARPHLPILHFNGYLQSALAVSNGVELSYRSNSRAMAMLGVRAARMEVDGEVTTPQYVESSMPPVLMLPRGSHTIKLWTEPAVRLPAGGTSLARAR